MLGRDEYLIIRDGGLFFFDKVDPLVPEGTWPVRVNVEVAGNVGRDHHRLRLVAVQKCLQYILGKKAEDSYLVAGIFSYASSSTLCPCE